MFYNTYDASQNQRNSNQSTAVTPYSPHSETIHRLFEQCLSGTDRLYAKVLQQTETETSFENRSNIYISLITENMLRYDEYMFLNMEENINMARRYDDREAFRPYIIEFAVDMENITQEVYRRLTDPEIMGMWYEASFLEEYGNNTAEWIVVAGSVLASASPFEFHGRRLFISGSHAANHITHRTKQLYNTVSSIRSHTHINDQLSNFLGAEDYQLSVYNVGDGNCIYIKGSDGKRILFDIGHNYNPYSKDWRDPDIKRTQRAIWCFRPLGVILSHWDMDHLVGVMFANDSIYDVDWIAPDPNVLPDRQFSVGAARIAKYLESRHILNLVNANERNRCIYHGTRVAVWCGQGHIHGGRLTEANNASLIIEFDKALEERHRVDAGQAKRTLLSGDCEYLALPVAMGFSAKKYEILVVPHHCSEMDTTAVAATGKGVAIISVSSRNRKRPNLVHMDALKMKGYLCYPTRSCCIEVPSVWSSACYIR